MGFKQIFTVALIVLCHTGSISATNVTNITCDTNFTLAICPNKSNCLDSCDGGFRFNSDDCETRSCTECHSGNWCDGTDSYECPITGMTSPMGSMNEDSCKCHDGYMIEDTNNGTKCMACPQGSWCNVTHTNACPEGTTSQVLSTSEEHCYCLPGYNHTTIDCEERTNDTHIPCNTGHFFTTDDICAVCSVGFWCDGDSQNRCDKGMTSPLASSGLDNCSCNLAYHRDKCTATLTFTVDLSMTEDEFDDAKQILYIETIEKHLAVSTGSVYIDSISNTTTNRTTSRRLLSSTIHINTVVLVPGTLANNIAVSNQTVLMSELRANGFQPTQTTVILVEHTNDTVESDDTIVIVLGLVASVLLAMGVSGWAWNKYCRTDKVYHQLTDRERGQPQYV